MDDAITGVAWYDEFAYTLRSQILSGSILKKTTIILI